MKLILLAAGEGKRMRPLTETIPKPLLSYRGKPHLDHFFQELPPAIDEVIISVWYLGERIRAHCGRKFHSRPVSYVSGGSTGNAEGFMNARAILRNGERFAVAYADEIITRREMEACLAHPLSWLYYHKDDPTDVGVALLRADGTIERIVEKSPNPPTTIVVDGFMVTTTDIFRHAKFPHAGCEWFVSEIMGDFAAHEAVVAVEADDTHMQLSVPADLEKLDALS